MKYIDNTAYAYLFVADFINITIHVVERYVAHGCR